MEIKEGKGTERIGKEWREERGMGMKKKQMKNLRNFRLYTISVTTALRLGSSLPQVELPLVTNTTLARLFIGWLVVRPWTLPQLTHSPTWCVSFLVVGGSSNTVRRAAIPKSGPRRLLRLLSSSNLIIAHKDPSCKNSILYHQMILRQGRWWQPFTAQTLFCWDNWLFGETNI